jgi:hypothetical protein
VTLRLENEALTEHRTIGTDDRTIHENKIKAHPPIVPESYQKIKNPASIKPIQKGLVLTMESSSDRILTTKLISRHR